MDLASAREFLRASLDQEKLRSLAEQIQVSRGENNATWDKAARQTLLIHLDREFDTRFGGPPIGTICMEGEKSERRIPESWRIGKFFGSATYPDGAIICEDKAIALELDHGDKGSRLRNALAKAAFAVQIGGYCECHLAYVWEKPESLRERTAAEKVILRRYKKNRKTFLHLVSYAPARRPARFHVS